MSNSSPNEVYDWAQDPGAFATPPTRRELRARQGRDGAIYTRQQKGKSFVLWWFFLGPVTLWIPTLYFHFSPRYFWKA